MIFSRRSLLAAVLLSGASVIVPNVSAGRLGQQQPKNDEKTTPKERNLHLLPTDPNGYRFGSTGGEIQGDAHQRFVNSAPVCHASSRNGNNVNGAGPNLYLDICDPNTLNGASFTQSTCSYVNQTQCTNGGGLMMMDMDTQTPLCIRNEAEVCANSHPDYKTLHVMAAMESDGAGGVQVHYWGCQCIRTHRYMEPLFTARTFTAPPDDSDPSMLRFNKFDYTGSIPGGVFIKNFPSMTAAEMNTYAAMPDLDKDDYPITADDAVVDRLRKSNAISVVNETDYEIKHNVQSLIESVGGGPSHPTCDSTTGSVSPFWEELEHVVDVAIYRRENPDLHSSALQDQFPSSWNASYIPSLWKDMTIAEVAEAVHDEPPGYHQAQLIHKFLASPEGLKENRTIMPGRSSVEFISAVVRLYDMNTHFINLVGPHNFAAKWNCGRARPEEAVAAIVNDDIGEGCLPDDLRTKIKTNFASLKDLVFTGDGSRGYDATSFTAYDEGSPRHPSWPAMHSAASVISYWMQVIYDLTDEQMCEAMMIDYSVSYARTIAGVHYISDNVDGLNMGKEVLRRELPGYLKYKFGADEAAARARADEVAASFDWNDYYPGSPEFEALCGAYLPFV